MTQALTRLRDGDDSARPDSPAFIAAMEAWAGALGSEHVVRDE